MLDWLFEWFQRRCPHSSGDVRADITEGASETAVQWCLRCGAYRFNSEAHGLTEWRGPRATWAE